MQMLLLPKDTIQLDLLHAVEDMDFSQISIYSNINNVSVEKVLKEFGGKNFSTFKSKLSESVVEKICPIGEEIKKLLEDEGYLTGVLEKGAKKADLIAKSNIKEIYDIIGLAKFS